MSFFPDLAAPFQTLLDALAGQSVVVVGHARPDGDCIGSQVALARVLRARGIDTVCYNPDPVPRRLDFLVGDIPFFQQDAYLEEVRRSGSRVAVFVDCADHHRAGAAARELFVEPLGTIDHHIGRGQFAKHEVIDSHAAATAEILAGLFFDFGLPVDAETARGLYAGIATDTGQFRFQSTTRRVFELAGRLIDCGADPAAIATEIYERESFEKLELLGRFLSSMRLECGGRVCAGRLRLADFEETGALPEDTEGLVDYARGIDGIEIGCLVEERPDGTKASLRAKHPEYRVDLIAAEFGGGGHQCAAGLNTKESIDELYPRLMAAIAARLKAVDDERK
ncbi:MAG: bifunctional oligoribonuclease/PAP phosphatase NrnA [Verrucomicrobia bacterium]|nr:MAG: bifunctional oligoribonuclease/PAP phosphatase NrnA [Verrucomicrobiota bacterium]